jgi:dTDP-glucose 4,6-dehydratase
MKYLISGGFGFIGSNIVLDLLSKDNQILILDKLTYAANTKGLEERSNLRLIKCDISNMSQDVCTQIKNFKPDYLIHLAAESMVDRSLHDNRVFFETNVLGTWALLELMKGLEIRKAVFFSTDETYGSLCLEGFNRDSSKFGFSTEQKLDPHNPYAGSKAAADQVTLSYIHNFKLPICIVRPTNNYGPRQHKEKLLPLSITNLLQNKKIPVYGAGLNFREWLYVDDTCSAVSMLLADGKIGEVYNIGSGKRHTNMEVLTQLCKIMNLSLDDSIQYVTDRHGHDLAYAVDSTSMLELGWQPQIRLDEGLQKTVEWYQTNKDWWQPLI